METAVLTGLEPVSGLFSVQAAKTEPVGSSSRFDTFAQIITRRSYCRPLDMDDPVEFESRDEMIERAIDQQVWLWERAQGSKLKWDQRNEINELRWAYMEGLAAPAGRVLWLGGTEKIKEVEIASFNCTAKKTRTVHDFVDQFWVLLNGCGAGGYMETGTLHGFANRIDAVEVITSKRGPRDKGRPDNHERYDDREGIWTIRVGDSAQAWAKAFGKLIVGYRRGCKKLVLDFSEVRGAGGRLKGYGWICHGPAPLEKVFRRVIDIRNGAIGRPLSRDEMHDLFNLIATVLSTRRAAEITMCDLDDPDVVGFARFKEVDLEDSLWSHRTQSNNTILARRRPTEVEFDWVFDRLFRGGKGEPALRNMVEVRKRSAYSSLTNACGEINLSAEGGVCNLVENHLGHEKMRDMTLLRRVLWLNARANYRQTCVDFRDGVLQSSWHEVNQHLRLCGTGVFAVAEVDHLLSDDDLISMRGAARAGADSMADELGLPRSAAVTTIKPGGTIPKCWGGTSGISNEVAPFVFFNVNFTNHDPLLPRLIEAGYSSRPNPYDPDQATLVALPKASPAKACEKLTAVQQLNRYLRWNRLYVEHNTSSTVVYDPGEEQSIRDWVRDNWDHGYISAAFLPRKAPNYLYLPQEPVDEETFRSYTARLKPFNVDADRGGYLYNEDEMDGLGIISGCATGACPAR
jgi:adenosylcobalamin-dependent ribonucleoside-triphosphate reductase